MKKFKAHFESLVHFTLSELLQDEKAAISYSAEQSYFMRFNHAKVRQNGTVEQAYVNITLWTKKRTYSFSCGLSLDHDSDIKILAEALQEARNSIRLLPEDPYQAEPSVSSVSASCYKGKLIEEDLIPEKVLQPAAGLDFTGLYSQGKICKGSANSSGAKHWFETETFVLDYSIWLENGRAVKSLYAGREWDDETYKAKIASARKGLEALSMPQKKLSPGKYKAFICADALIELLACWHDFSSRKIKQGESAFIALMEERETFSPMFNLTQDFSMGLEPFFNSLGETAPEKLEIIKNGKLVNTLISSRTAKQYGIRANGAPDSETLRAVSIEGGALNECDAVKELGTGIYISNFHYTNWSDNSVARVTGMTRFACLWVEDGKITAPISDMRWDESLYNMFGANLIALTKEVHTFASTSTYDQRNTGGCRLPGILVKDFNCTL